ncbi:hypothetical protein [Rhizobium sp. WYJ-E13]|uniref:hypothetical protein n=1 Tax=Rhizobium sp. WYJ-E13 TaxID=2849093 RepID=UPI001C1EC7B6|nr:hypothetical protein [Rhizobium sp. WYJ-E13]QWW71175.1 hypothetical protein KQ933_30945 [Rhizobium sp. WYJ-E13]
MSTKDARNQFIGMLLAETAPEELPLLETYVAAIDTAEAGRRAGKGLGIPPEWVGAIGVASVFVGQVVYNVLGEWVKDTASEIAKKYVVDTGVEALKGWLKRPDKASLDKVLTTDGRLAILKVVEEDATKARLSRKDTEKLKKSVLKRLGVG